MTTTNEWKNVLSFPRADDGHDATGDRARDARDGERDDDDERAVALDRGAVPDDDARDAREGEG